MMSEREMRIITGNELNSLLGRAYWIETQFELIIQWKAYNEVSEELRDVLFVLSHDSEKHKMILQQLCDNLEGINPQQVTKDMAFDTRDFKFEGKLEEEIALHIQKNEYLALDIYKKIRDFSDKELIKTLWQGDNPVWFFQQLDFLIKEEQKHISMVQPYIGKIERIL
jgi:hypothetical protein